MKTPTAILLSAVLAAFFVSVAPTASADTCASAYAEEVVCPPILAAYCTLYAVVEKYSIVDCALRAVPGDLEISLP